MPLATRLTCGANLFIKGNTHVLKKYMFPLYCIISIAQAQGLFVVPGHGNANGHANGHARIIDVEAQIVPAPVTTTVQIVSVASPVIFTTIFRPVITSIKPQPTTTSAAIVVLPASIIPIVSITVSTKTVVTPSVILARKIDTSLRCDSTLATSSVGASKIDYQTPYIIGTDCTDSLDNTDTTDMVDSADETDIVDSTDEIDTTDGTEALTSQMEEDFKDESVIAYNFASIIPSTEVQAQVTSVTQVLNPQITPSNTQILAAQTIAPSYTQILAVQTIAPQVPAEQNSSLSASPQITDAAYATPTYSATNTELLSLQTSQDDLATAATGTVAAFTSILSLASSPVTITSSAITTTCYLSFIVVFSILSL